MDRAKPRRAAETRSAASMTLDSGCGYVQKCRPLEASLAHDKAWQGSVAETDVRSKGVLNF
jgi:hypothetical protein